jgi:hypothetical protein|tara:strand:- start:39 stop:935 length:897 start_codon:yes stop_codon:yes gene_type:complete
MTSKKIVLIQSHCNTKEKINFLKNNILTIKNLGLDVLLFSHIPLPEEIIELTDYFIYDKSNPIMWDERRHHYWKTFGPTKLSNTVPEYGWAVYNQVIKGSQLALQQDYDYYYLMCYDTIIGNVVLNCLDAPSPIITFKHRKPDGVTFDATLIFSCFNKENLNKLINSFDRAEYASQTHLITEEYLKSKIEQLSGKLSNKFVTDQFHESTDIFNQNTHNNKFKIFLSNEGKFCCLVYDIHCELVLIVNNQAYTINEHKLLDLSNHIIINNLGYLLDGEYYNLLPSYNKLSLRKIESLNV